MNSSPVCISLALAKMAVKANKPDIAAERYTEALQAAWWCWEAYEGLCALGKAPDADKTFSDVEVPVVRDAERQEEPPPASFLSAQPMSAQNSRAESIGVVSKPSFGQLRAQHGASSATPSFAFNKSKGKTAMNGLLEANQGTGFHFGENGMVEAQADALEGPENSIHGLGGRGQSADLSISLDDIPIGDGSSGSSFFATSGPSLRKKGPATGNGGGLFGFQNAPSGIPQLTRKKPAAPMFGTGLLFGNSASTASQAGSSQAPASFFTPPPAQEAGSSNGRAAQQHRFGSSTGPGRPHLQPGKRIRVDSETQLPSLLSGSTNGRDADSMEAEDQESLDGKSGFMQRGGSLDPDLAIHAAPRKGSAQIGATTRRSTRLNSAGPTNAANVNGITAANSRRGPSANAMTAKVANRAASNPRDRKRSKAGPSNYDDTASETHSFESASQNGGMYPSTSSSSPPASASQLENIPPFSTAFDAFQQPGFARSSMAISTTSANSLKASHTSQAPFSSTSASSNPAGASPYPTSQPLQPSLSAVAHATYKSQVRAAQQALAENWLQGVYRNFGDAYSSLSRYDYPGVLRGILALPLEQQKSPRALSQLGVAYFHNLEYVKAAGAFSAVRELAPCYTAHMDVYSTVLWHLHRPVQLSFLAQEIMAISPLLPQAWIAVGNVFSHLEDHTNALRSFKRAIQSDPSWTYAYTLAGHESVTLEEWEAATGFFRDAIRREPRHYTAWYASSVVGGDLYLTDLRNSQVWLRQRIYEDWQVPPGGVPFPQGNRDQCLERHAGIVRRGCPREAGSQEGGTGDV